MNCYSDLPYPKVESDAPNLKDAMIIRETYAGSVSETTAILGYIYDHLILDEIDSDIAAVMKKIAISEMRHLELLGDAIVALGGDPIYYGMRYPFSGSYVTYRKAVRPILMSRIAGEKSAIRGYRHAIAHLSNESAKALLERIIIDEEIHIDVLEDMLRSIS
ncbi:MAG: rubrerythrin [Clostridia bacterium]|jgi:bacterioferritin|nr:rubrerythrin [Clostridia bacterium]MCX4367382.1 ferritin-like domain-containing protein [Clostridia bacterium]